MDNFTPLVGQNNTGKSSILEAIAWVLKPSALSRNDFFDDKKPVIISARVEGVTDDILNRIPEPKHRKAIEPYCLNGTLWIQVQANGTTAGSLSKRVWDPEHYDGEGLPASWREYPTGLPQAVSALLPEPLFVQAMDDVSEDLGKAKAGSTIKKLLDEIMEPVLKAHTDLSSALDTIKHILAADGDNRSSHLKDFDEHATRALVEFFPGLSLDLDLQVLDVKEFFKAGDLHCTDSTTGDRRRFDQMGTGAQRSIQMALIRYLADARSTSQETASRRLLLIDEPELYLHPQGVRHLRQALSALSKTGFQVIFSTHSPLMLSRENAADTIIVGKGAEMGVFTRKPLRQAVLQALASAESQARTLFELGNLAEIYFCDRVVLCEGKTDVRLMSMAYEKLYGQTSEIDQIVFVNMGSCSDIPKALPVLATMGIQARALADLDFAFTEARKGSTPLLYKDGKDLQDVKTVLKRLQSVHGFPLADNGLPKSDRRNGWIAADTWALMAEDSDGKAIADSAHIDLKKLDIWVWPVGAIEHAMGVDKKGEEAILEQEKALMTMDRNVIESAMPEVKRCLDWVRS